MLILSTLNNLNFSHFSTQTENPKDSRKLSTPRQSQQDTYETFDFLWKGKSIADYKSIRWKSKNYLETEKLDFRSNLWMILLQL